MPRAWIIGILVGAVALVVLLLWATQPSETPAVTNVFVNIPSGEVETPSAEEIREKAAREKQLVWYTSAPEEAARTFLGAFEQRYPFLTTRLERASTFDIVERLHGEIRAGETEADVLHVLDVGTFITLKDEGELRRYDSPEYPAFAVQYKDDGYWASMRTVALCMARDVLRVPDEQAPKRWEDLLDPDRWQPGQVGLENAQAGSQYAQYYFLRDLYGLSFWQRLARQKPRLFNSAENMLEALGSGEIQIAGEMADYAIYDFRRQGRGEVVPIWPEDGVPVVVAPVGILRLAPHPNAARLFVDFALSRDGQELLQELIGAYSVRSDVTPLPGKPRLTELEVLAPSRGWDDYRAKQAEYRAEFSGLFQPGSE